MTVERQRLDEDGAAWRRWGPYVSDRAWGTVREDYSANGDAWGRSNAFSDKDLYIPFSAVTHIDPREVFVSKTKEELRRKYSNPPPRSTLLEEKIDFDTGEDDSRAITTEPSGYDGTPVVVDEAHIGKLAHHIAPGFRVYTSELECVGRVKQYDRETKQMLVERGMFSRRDLLIPVYLIAMVDREDRDIYLAVSSTDLERMQHGAPGTGANQTHDG
jgi:hypothetical protein